MKIYTVIHLSDFGKTGSASCSINLHHFISKDAAIDNMYARFERCCEAFDELGEYYDSDINEHMNYAYIRHFEGDQWGPEPQTPVYDHEWRIITEIL
jgi:hypothetical protein